MTADEIKKVLYKEKPIATLMVASVSYLEYVAKTSLGKIKFRIPKEEVGEGFNDEEPAQLLTRWILLTN